MTKKLVSLSLALFVIAVPAASHAAKGRSAYGEYNTLVVRPGDSPGAEGHISNTVEFKTKTGERWVNLVIEDKSGMPVRVVVAQDRDGDGIAETELQEICGSTDAPIRFKPGAPISVAAQETPCNDTVTRPATFGSVTATFLR